MSSQFPYAGSESEKDCHVTPIAFRLDEAAATDLLKQWYEDYGLGRSSKF